MVRYLKKSIYEEVWAFRQYRVTGTGFTVSSETKKMTKYLTQWFARH